MLRCSIVIPTCNREALLVRAVQSALLACPADGEVLVVDDKSAISASTVLASISDNRLKVLVNIGRSGAAATRNLGVSNARGEIVFFLDDDDELLEDYCRKVLSPVGPTSVADWGFSSTVVRTGDKRATDSLRVRKRLSKGSFQRMPGYVILWLQPATGYGFARVCICRSVVLIPNKSSTKIPICAHGFYQYRAFRGTNLIQAQLCIGVMYQRVQMLHS